jgi:hypothetical protein
MPLDMSFALLARKLLASHMNRVVLGVKNYLPTGRRVAPVKNG